MIKEIARNKKAHFEYFILDKYEAGIMLEGSEVKSVRAGGISLAESYVRVINGELLNEPYLQDDVITDSLQGAFTDLVVPENSVFAMGDNRAHSRDCRSFGCIPLEKIESKVLIRFWPLNLFGKVD